MGDDDSRGQKSIIEMDRRVEKDAAVKHDLFLVSCPARSRWLACVRSAVLSLNGRSETDFFETVTCGWSWAQRLARSQI